MDLWRNHVGIILRLAGLFLAFQLLGCQISVSVPENSEASPPLEQDSDTSDAVSDNQNSEGEDVEDSDNEDSPDDPKPTPDPTPNSTAVPEQTSQSDPTPQVTPPATPEATATPTPQPTITPTATPAATPTPSPTPTPQAATPLPTPTPNPELGQDSRLPAFFMIELSGGAGLAGANVMVGGTGGQKDYLSVQAYGTLGLSAELHPETVGVAEDMGLVFHSQSWIYQAMADAIPEADRPYIDGAVFCAPSNDDSNLNRFNPLAAIAKAGRLGTKAAIVGTEATSEGGRYRSAYPNYSALAELTAATVTSESEAAALADDNNWLPTSEDSRYNGLFDLNNRVEAETAAIAKLVFEGYAGSGVINLGGYDYHTQYLEAVVSKDRIAGSVIGKILQLANILDQPVMVLVTTDGAVSSASGASPDPTTGRLPFRGDSGNRSVSFLMTRHTTPRTDSPNRRPRQLGYFNDGGSVAQGLPPEVVAQVTLLNYLYMTGNQAQFEPLHENDRLGSNDLSPYIIGDEVSQLNYGRIEESTADGTLVGYSTHPSEPRFVGNANVYRIGYDWKSNAPERHFVGRAAIDPISRRFEVPLTSQPIEYGTKLLLVTVNYGAQEYAVGRITIDKPFDNKLIPVRDAALVAPWELKNDLQGTLDGTYITTTQVPRQDDPNLVAPVVIKFQVDEAGVYEIYGRYQAPSLDRNSIWFQVDDGPIHLNGVYPPENGWVTSAWFPYKVNDNNGQTSATFNLTAGEHTLNIRVREWGLMIDGFMLQKIAPTSENPQFPTATVKQILAENCFSCHPADGSRQQPPLGDREVFQQHGDQIKRRIRDPNAPMPPQGLLSEADNTLIRQWIDLGMPE